MRVIALKVVPAALLLTASAVVAADSPQTRPSAPAAAAPAAAAVRAVAVMHPASGSKVSGVVTFTEVAAGVEVKVELSGLTPGKHGFHVHELGDCSAADASSTGGHYNPTGHPHAGMEAAARHEGDLGNVEAGADGRVSVTFVDRGLELKGAHSIVGRGVIVHASADDFTTQPTGNAGGRVACGVVGWGK